MPNLITYFDLNLKSAANVNSAYEKKFIYLISEYLLNQKNIIERETSLIMQRSEAEVAATEIEQAKAKKASKTKINSFESTKNNQDNSIYEHYTKSKQLTQLIRLFEDKKFLASNLRSSVLNYISNTLVIDKKSNAVIEDASQKLLALQVFILTPVMFQNQANINTLILQLNTHLLEFLENDLKSQADSFDKSKLLSIQSRFETCSFLLSLSVWSLVLCKNNEAWTRENANNIKMLTNVMLLIETISSNLKTTTSSKDDLSSFQKSLNHLLRCLNYLLIKLEIETDKNSTGERLKFKSIVQPVISLVKAELSSPYHENRFNSLNILSFFYKSDGSAVNSDNLGKNGENLEQEKETENIFEICIKAEETPASLEKYRQKLYYLQRLDPNACSKHLTSHTQDVI